MVLNEIPSFPESISHKKLNTLLFHAQKELTNEKSIHFESQEKKDRFKELLTTWSSISKELITSLKKNEKELKDLQGSKSLLALGAMEAHINMALQALQASEMEE